METVLVGVDGSKTALHALKHAVGLAEGGRAQLRLLYVQQAITVSPEWQHVDESYDRLTELAFVGARRLLADRNIKVDWDVHIGDPAPTIVAYARRHGCSQIVLGNSARSAMAALFGGSVALKVVQLATVPITLVK